MSLKIKRILLPLTMLALFVYGCSSPQTAATPDIDPGLPNPVVEQAATPVTPTETSLARPSPTEPPVEAEPGGVIRFTLVPERSEARYRVTEELVNVSLPNDAIGRTQQVNGTLAINPDGTLLAGEAGLEWI